VSGSSSSSAVTSIIIIMAISASSSSEGSKVVEQTPWGPLRAAEKEVGDALVEETFRLQELLNTPPVLSSDTTMESFYATSHPQERVEPGERLGSASTMLDQSTAPGSGSQKKGYAGPRVAKISAPRPPIHVATTEELETRLAGLKESVKALETQNLALKEQTEWRVSGKPRSKDNSRPDPRAALQSELKVLLEEKERLAAETTRLEKKLAETEAKFRSKLPTRSTWAFGDGQVGGAESGRPLLPPVLGAAGAAPSAAPDAAVVQEGGGTAAVADAQAGGNANSPQRGPPGALRPINKVDEYRELIEHLQWERHVMTQEHQKTCRKIARRVNGYFHLERKLGVGLQKLSFLVLRQQAEIRHLLALLPVAEREKVMQIAIQQSEQDRLQRSQIQGARQGGEELIPASGADEEPLVLDPEVAEPQQSAGSA